MLCAKANSPFFPTTLQRVMSGRKCSETNMQERRNAPSEQDTASLGSIFVTGRWLYEPLACNAKRCNANCRPASRPQRPRLKSLHGDAKKRSEVFPTLLIEGSENIYRGFRDEGLIEGLSLNNNMARQFIEGPRTH